MLRFAPASAAPGRRGGKTSFRNRSKRRCVSRRASQASPRSRPACSPSCVQPHHRPSPAHGPAQRAGVRPAGRTAKTGTSAWRPCFNEKALAEGLRPTAGPIRRVHAVAPVLARLEACLDHLPPNTGRVFMMREFLGFDSDEIWVNSRRSDEQLPRHPVSREAQARGCIESGWGRPGSEPMLNCGSHRAVLARDGAAARPDRQGVAAHAPDDVRFAA